MQFYQLWGNWIAALQFEWQVFTYSWAKKQINVTQWMDIIAVQMQMYAKCYISPNNKVAKVAIENKQRQQCHSYLWWNFQHFLSIASSVESNLLKSAIYITLGETHNMQNAGIYYIRAHTVLNLEAWELWLCVSPPSSFHYLKEHGVVSWHGSIVTLPVHYQRWMPDIWGGK